MSDSRRPPLASRRNPSKATIGVSKIKQLNYNNQFKPYKRPNAKNLANDRLKKLRTKLSQDVNQLSSSSLVNVRKRPSNGPVEEDTAKRAKKHEENEEMEWSTFDNAPTTSDSYHNQKDLTIVVDTNIFLSNMQLVKRILNTKNTTDNLKPVIYIPWMVIEELDFIKDGNKSNLKIKAQEAIKYIAENFEMKNDRIRGQTLEEANEQLCGQGQDNKILAACLQLLKSRRNMLFLTNDTNLRNKAHLNNIPVCSEKNIMAKIDTKHTKIDMILKRMLEMCQSVIKECGRNAYGAAYLKMPIGQPPKTFQDSLDMFKKYWSAVFQDVLLKQFKKAVDDMVTFLAKDDTGNVDELVRLCVRMCLFLKDVECCRDTIEATIRYLNNIKDS